MRNIVFLAIHMLVITRATVDCRAHIFKQQKYDKNLQRQQQQQHPQQQLQHNQQQQQQRQIAALKHLKQAYLEIIFYTEDVGNGGFLTTTYQVKGKFANSGTYFNAEGRIRKINLNSICNATRYYPPRLPFSWIAFLEVADTPQQTGTNFLYGKEANCMSTIEKVEHVLNQGARAVLISYSKVSNIQEKMESIQSNKPVVMVSSFDSQRIEPMIGRGRKNFIRIKARTLQQRPPDAHRKEGLKNNEYFDMAIFLAFFIIVSLICLILLIKLKWRQNRKKQFRAKIAREALKSMRIRKYPPHDPKDVSEHDFKNLFGIKTCTVCLEEFNCGKDIRILPCNHEFHQECIDPWLMTNFTCPLCMYSIIETKKLKHKSRRRIIPEFIARRFRSNTQSSTESTNSTIIQQQDNNTNDIEVRSISPPATLPITNHLQENYNQNQHRQHNGSLNSDTHIFRFHTCPFHSERKSKKANENLITTDIQHKGGRLRACHLSQTFELNSSFRLQKENRTVVSTCLSKHWEESNLDLKICGTTSLPQLNQLQNCSQNSPDQFSLPMKEHSVKKGRTTVDLRHDFLQSIVSLENEHGTGKLL